MNFKLTACTIALAVCTPLTAQAPLKSAGCKTEYFLIKALAGSYAKAHKVQVKAAKTGNKVAAKLLQAGKIDFAFTCKPAAKLIKKLKLDKKKTAGWTSFLVAKDPVAVVANRKAGVSGLTLAQLKAIYLGKVSNWKEVGGVDLPILAASLDKSVESGTPTVFKENTIGAKTPMSKQVKRLKDPKFLGNYCRSKAGAVVFMSLASYLPGHGTLLAIDGITPSRKTILSGKYPIVANYYLTFDKASTAKVKHFFTFTCSRKGSAIIDRIMVAAGRAAPKPVATPGK